MRINDLSGPVIARPENLDHTNVISLRDRGVKNIQSAQGDLSGENRNPYQPPENKSKSAQEFAEESPSSGNRGARLSKILNLIEKANEDKRQRNLIISDVSKSKGLRIYLKVALSTNKKDEGQALDIKA